MASWFRDLTDTLGFTKKKIPPSALPQIDTGKRGAENLYGEYATEKFKKVKEFGGDEPLGYYRLPEYKPTMPTYQPRQTTQAPPIQIPEAGRAVPQQFTQPGQVSIIPGQAGTVQPYTAEVQAAINAAKAVSTPTQVGYDPAMRQAAVTAATSGIAEQKDLALQQAREMLGKSGIAQSTVGAKTLGNIGGQYDRATAEAIANIDVRNLEAEREDRYRNPQAALSAIQQVAGLAGQGAGLAGQEYEMGRSGRQEDRGERDYADSIGNKDFERWLTLQGIDTSARGVDREEAWRRYNEETRKTENIYGEDTRRAEATAETLNKAQLFNIGQEMTQGERQKKQVDDLLEMLRVYASGNQITPESQIASQKYAAETGGQQSALSNTLGTITNLFGIFRRRK